MTTTRKARLLPAIEAKGGIGRAVEQVTRQSKVPIRTASHHDLAIGLYDSVVAMVIAIQAEARQDDARTAKPSIEIACSLCACV